MVFYSAKNEEDCEQDYRSFMSSQKTSFEQKAREFLAVSSQFKLGELPTEQPHPLTANLSTLAQENLKEAMRVLHTVDASALECLLSKTGEIMDLARSVKTTLDAGRSVYLCGCGATGRLSLACETLWRAAHRHDGLQDRVIGFMAGGDAALVRSIENFEDYPEHGARHLDALGFADGDLFIGCTEGGETPFVIGATLWAAEISSNPPFFLYCNPDEVLCKVAERSAYVIKDSRIRKINCFAGPMALAGSTRMQASTVLMCAAGTALLWHADQEAIHGAVSSLLTHWNSLDLSFLEPFIIRESSLYQQGGYLLYCTDKDLAIAILTDTTERAPTFATLPFEGLHDTRAEPSLCYLCLPQAHNGSAAWELILGRAPRAMEGGRFGGGAPAHQALNYDFSAQALARRTAAVSPARQSCFTIKHCAEGILFDFDGFSHLVPLHGLPMLSMHIMLKMLLNMHSTLVMGRLGRYDGNIMTWVKPSNNKLIDRAIRYADILLKKKGISETYERIAYACFEMMEKVPADESLVHTVVRAQGGGDKQPSPS
jgi:N-acetylmuramic acid 6-phosphate etherase